MEMKSPPPCSNTVTVRRNPLRRARATPSSKIPLPLPLSSTPSSNSKDIPSFPIEDTLSIEVPQNPNKSEEQQSENLKVFLRIRPLSIAQSSVRNTSAGARKNVWPQNPSAKHSTKGKPKRNSEICLKEIDSHSVSLCPPQILQDQKRNKSEVYEGFSHVFSADCSQDEVYNTMMNPLVEDFLKGKSGMLAALGPSGSGKTHTIFGTNRQPGLVPLLLRRIFTGNEDNAAQSSRTFYLSMFEISSERGKVERMLDLCKDGGELSMHQSTVRGLQESIVCDVQQAESLIAQGMMRRATATTNSNDQSSRSQCIINIRCETMDGVDALSQSSLLTIVDLAGAEREKRTGNQGARLLESNFINNTSMVFGLCLRSLLEHQKNHKKPLQKHFQNSLLTRYLRDYLEGKKRMALILTVKAGEEDYPDASYLLRQASPYMKIKFSNSEEPSDSISNKRPFQMFLKAEKLKRMKISTTESCMVNDGKADGIHIAPHKEERVRAVTRKQVKNKEVTSAKLLPQSPDTLKSEDFEDTSLNDRITELLKGDRESQIMQGFAKATWKVLKQCNEKLKVVEKERDYLRESLTMEKARLFELEKELDRFKVVAEKERESLRENLTVEKAQVFELQKELKKVKSCFSCENKFSREETLIEVFGSRENGPDVHSELEGYQSTDSYEAAKAQFPGNLSVIAYDYRKYFSCCLLFTPFHFPGHQKCWQSREDNDNAEEVAVIEGRKDDENLENPDDKKCENSPANDEDLVNHEDIVREDTSSNDEGSGLTENLQVLNYQIGDTSPTNTYSEKDEDCKDEGREYTFPNDEGSGLTKNSQLQSYQRDDDCPTNIYTVKDYDHKDEGRVDTSTSDEATVAGTMLLEDQASPSQPLIKGDDSSSSNVMQQLQTDVKEKILDQSRIREEAVPEMALKHISAHRPPKAEKPKRRLQPASSILLKNISDLNIEEENEKPKGDKGAKNLGLDVSRRSQGSISLLRLLKDNIQRLQAL